MYSSESKEKPGRLGRVAKSAWLDRVVLIAIIVNSVQLAITAGDEPKKGSWAFTLELGLFGVFLVEFVIKVCAWGWLYFYDSWNLIDAAVVAEGCYSIGMLLFSQGAKRSGANISALRIMRLLRPLRTLKRFPEMRLLVESLLNSGHLLLVGVGIVCMAIYAFAVAGYVYFSQGLDKRCVALPYYDAATGDYVQEATATMLAAHWMNQSAAERFVDRDLCGSCATCRRCNGPYEATTQWESPTLGPAGTSFVARERCVDVDYSIDGDMLKFDTVGWAFMAVFDMTNLEGWNDVLWSMQDTRGTQVWVYFVAIVVVLNFICLNVFPAIIAFNLRSAIREEENRLGREAKHKLGADAMSLSSFEEMVVDMLAAETEDVADIEASLSRHRTGCDGAARTTAVAASAERPEARYPAGRWRVAAREIADPPLGAFQLGIYTVIFANVVVLAAARPYPSSAQSRREEALAAAFTTVFVLELLFKVFGYGVRGYLADWYNRFDAVLVGLALMQLLVNTAPNVFHLLRVARVAKLSRVVRIAAVAKVARVRRMTDAQMDFARLMGVLTSSGVWLINIVALAGLVMYMFAILGMILFRDNVYALDDDAKRYYAAHVEGYRDVAYDQDTTKRRCDAFLGCRGTFNFDTFPMAFMTVFIVVSLDGWNTVLYHALRVQSSSLRRGVTFVYFAVVIVVLRYVIISMIIAIIFDQVERDSIMVVRRNARVTMVSVFMLAQALDRSVKRRAFLYWRLRTAPAELAGASETARARGAAAELTDAVAGARVTVPEDDTHRATRWELLVADDRSLCLFAPGSRVRQLCVSISSSPYWTSFILGVILASVSLLAVDQQQFIAKSADHDDQLYGGRTKALLVVANALCVGTFVLEFVVEVIARGLILPARTGYLRDPKNCLDTLVTCLSLLNYVFDHTGLIAARLLRLLRVVRPLKRLARGSHSVHAIFEALEFSRRALANVVILCLVALVVFAVVGMQLFRGLLFYCGDPEYPPGRPLSSRRLCGFQPLVWGVPTKLQNSLARSNQSRFG